jgi:hypothetical protein
MVIYKYIMFVLDNNRHRHRGSVWGPLHCFRGKIVARGRYIRHRGHRFRLTSNFRCSAG